ncbi:MAG: hypothetical protein ACYSXF_04935 [Planctomycetota bacterium]
MTMTDNGRTDGGADVAWWATLRHGGLLLDGQRLRRLVAEDRPPLGTSQTLRLRSSVKALLADSTRASRFTAYVLEHICAFDQATGRWQRGKRVSPAWERRTITGARVRPQQLWQGPHGAVLAVFIDRKERLGVGHGRRATSQVLQWLRAGNEQLALLTNGRQWRLIFAGLDYDAWAEWDVGLWFDGDGCTGQVTALRSLLAPARWIPASDSEPCPLLRAINDTRRGKSELSEDLGERVRRTIEILVGTHGELLHEHAGALTRQDIYRAAIRMIMRMVVVLFAEARGLLPCGNAVYHRRYGLGGLREQLEYRCGRDGAHLSDTYSAYPRVLALFRLIHEGSHHDALQVPEYGGQLFAKGTPDNPDGVVRALHVFETGCYQRSLMPDRDVYQILELLTKTRAEVRQGRRTTWTPVPVDFADLSSEYIGILYEGLLDFELRTVPEGDAIVFLAVDNQPALPLSTLEKMGVRRIKSLLEKLRAPDSARADTAPEAADAEPSGGEAEEDARGKCVTARVRAERWARHSVRAASLVRKPRGRMSLQARRRYEAEVDRKARRLVARVVLPGEWYLVRWGGRRKGAGIYYTRPQLAVPTVQRALRPLAYGRQGKLRPDAPSRSSAPRKPEAILGLRVCDPACGSGSFLIAALRFLTEAVYESLFRHDRLDVGHDRTRVWLTGERRSNGNPGSSDERVPCRPADETFESRLKSKIKRYVVERCIYGVDIDPIAIELCRLSLWIETMDRELPFTFPDHKIKAGNSLVGC